MSLFEILIPDDALMYRQGSDRVDVYSDSVWSDGFTVGADEVRGWMTFRRYETGWVLAYAGGNGAWVYERLGADEVPVEVRSML